MNLAGVERPVGFPLLLRQSQSLHSEVEETRGSQCRTRIDIE